MESVTCGRVSPKLGKASPGCRTLVRNSKCRHAASRPTNSRAKGSDPQPPVRRHAIERRISKRLAAKLRPPEGRRGSDFLVCLELNETPTGGLHSQLQSSELVPVKANERATLSEQIVETQL